MSTVVDDAIVGVVRVVAQGKAMTVEDAAAHVIVNHVAKADRVEPVLEVCNLIDI